MNIGVTGANGFIGQNLCSALLKRKCSLKIDKLETFDRHKYSLEDVSSIERFINDKDVVFHLAGINRENSTSKFITVNTLGTLNLLEAIRLSSSNNRVHLVFSSSLQVYGFRPTPERLSEDSPLRPSNIYGLSKKFAEELIYRYCVDYGIQGLILRLSNVYGPGCKPNYNSVVSTFICSALRKEPIVIRGGGNSSRDFVYIDDVVEANMSSMLYANNSPEIFNICSGGSTSLTDLIRAISSTSGLDIQAEIREEGTVDFLVGDPSRSQKKLGFKSKISLDEGLRRTINWFRGESE